MGAERQGARAVASRGSSDGGREGAGNGGGRWRLLLLIGAAAAVGAAAVEEAAEVRVRRGWPVGGLLLAQSCHGGSGKRQVQ